MTVLEAIDAIRQEGTINTDRGCIKLRIAESAQTELLEAIETIRRNKQFALELLASAAPALARPGDSESDLGAIIRGHALELWSDSAGGRLFIVADEADARRLCERRGEVITVDELRLVVRIENPTFAAEVLRWKRTFDGTLVDVQKNAVSKPRSQ